MTRIAFSADEATNVNRDNRDGEGVVLTVLTRAACHC